MPKQQDLHFDIHASIVFQLGENLVTDLVQALVELVKNCYDADATFAKVTVHTTEAPPEGFHFDGAKGYVMVEDNGMGMSLDRIRDGWLVISNSFKRKMKADAKSTPKGRTPMGDKGLGRFGAQMLGDNVEIFTREVKSEVAYHVGFRWSDFRALAKLTEVEVFYEEATRKRPGTTLLVSNLNDPGQWAGDEAQRKLQIELSRMLSPFEQREEFTVTLSIDGKNIQLAEVSREVRNAAHVRYTLNFDGSKLTIEGQAKLDFFRPPRSKKEDRKTFQRLVEADKGEGLLTFLRGRSWAKGIHLAAAKSPWFVRFRRERAFFDFDSLALVGGKIANPGPFTGEVDSFDLSEADSPTNDVFSNAAELRQYIKDFAGIRVFRDGFGVRVDQDWLKFGERWTTGSSYYGLKPSNIIGYIAISAKDNDQLKETTDREGFSDTPHYRNFYEVLRQFVKFSSEAQEFLRRGWLEYRGTKSASSDDDENDTPLSNEELAKRFKAGLDSAATLYADLVTAGQESEKVVQRAHDVVNDVMEGIGTGKKKAELSSAVEALVETIEVAKDLGEKVKAHEAKAATLKDLGNQINVRLELLRGQVAEVYEVVGLGLTAEALSHEIGQVANGLAERTTTVKKHVRAKYQADTVLSQYLEHVTGSVAALRKELAHLAPSLKYVRHRREEIDIVTFARDMELYHRDRLAKDNISIDVVCKSATFTVKLNRGKLTQVFDNLCLNSEYWLKEEMRLGRLKAGVIKITIDNPYFQVSDNGRGVDPSIEATLFEPFVTAKGKEKGRGLGLFISAQLLESEGCTLSILPDRNKAGRIFIFQMDLTGAIQHG